MCGAGFGVEGAGLQVIARDKEDLDARWDRAVLYQEVGEHRRALACFDVIADARPGDGEVPPRFTAGHESG